MRFFCVTDGPDLGQRELLESACAQRHVEFVAIDAPTLDYSALPVVTEGDALYRTATTSAACLAELALSTPAARTFRTHYLRHSSRYPASFLVHQQAGISIPKTILCVQPTPTRLARYVTELGGFPIVLKAVGGSHGVGVMQIDSLSSLLSVVDYLQTQRNVLVLRQFIPARSSARLTVLDGEVIASIEYHAQGDDFRSNTGTHPVVLPHTFPTDVQDLACQAVAALGLTFGGVDILIDAQGKSYVTEVNFPCNFARAQQATGIDIAGKMIEHLIGEVVRV